MPHELHEHNQHALVCEIFQQIAREKNKSTERITNLFFLKQNNTIVRRFWNILDKKLLNHAYTGIGCCHFCGKFYLD